MNQTEKQNLQLETTNRRLFLRFRLGLNAIRKDIVKRTILIAYMAMVTILWLFRVPLFGLETGSFLDNLLYILFGILFWLGSGLVLMVMLVAFGTPFGSASIHNNLRRAGIVNHAGEVPFLLSRYKEKEQPQVTVLEFEANGIPRKLWEDKRASIETALNLHVASITEGADKRRILLHTVTADHKLPDKLHWKKEFLQQDSFVLTLGESLLGPVTINLDRVPHILLGGSTGSGKSVLLKLLLMQCIQKGADVSIADFKGGVDFPSVWHQKCRMCFEETDLLELLTDLVDELEQRKTTLRDAGCHNIGEYNEATPTKLQRLVFACDEIAELLDKNGRSKEAKDQIYKIENKLAVIARQGRAFGIHLILATQRPDATILTGQIRNNIDCRVCGRADDVLSQIILDNTAASDLIPKNARGRFLLHDGTIFQGYLFDESSI